MKPVCESLRFGCFCILAVLSLAGCSSAEISDFMDTASRGIFMREDVNLAEKNYAAADFLVQQINTFIGRSDLIVAEPLHEAGQPEITSDLGHAVPEQVGIRLSQLGYNVALDRVSSYAQEGASSSGQPKFRLGGTYVRGLRDVTVNLRLVEAGSGKVRGSFDYPLPMNNEIGDLSEPQTRIYKLPE